MGGVKEGLSGEVIGMAGWLELGARVSGTYLGNPFRGTVVDIAFPGNDFGGRTYTVEADEPINVSKSALFDMKRKRLMATLGDDGRSLDHKGRPNGIMAIAAEG
ncbi:MAG: hypothetical protein KIS96_04320 [Bauldia sp.]|nr:hypothetical protein [Bauldia sp.]